MAAKAYDVGDDELETMDRTALLDVVAMDIVSRRNVTSRRRSAKIRSSTGDGVAARIEKNGVGIDELKQRLKIDVAKLRLS